MAITYVGIATNPSDSTTYGVTGTGSPTALAVTPPTSNEGDLGVFIGFVSSATATRALSISEAGGQDWNNIGAASSTTGGVYRMDWCRFNGTWSANPSMIYSHATTDAMQVALIVFRPTSSAATWSVNAGGAASAFSGPSTPFDVTIPGITTTEPSNVSLALWLARDDNTWSLQTGGWTQPAAQYRSNYNTQASLCLAYLIQTVAGATGDVTNRQATLGGDSGFTALLSFAEAVPTSQPRALPQPYFVNYRI